MNIKDLKPEQRYRIVKITYDGTQRSARYELQELKKRWWSKKLRWVLVRYSRNSEYDLRHEYDNLIAVRTHKYKEEILTGKWNDHAEWEYDDHE